MNLSDAETLALSVCVAVRGAGGKGGGKAGEPPMTRHKRNTVFKFRDMLPRHQHHVTSWADAGQSELNKPAKSVSWLWCGQLVTPCGPNLPSDLLFVCTGESDASLAGVDRGVTTGSPGVSCHGGERPLLPHSSSALRVWFWFSLPKELRSRLPLQAPQPRG